MEPDKHTVNRLRKEHIKCKDRDTAFLKTSLDKNLKESADVEELQKSKKIFDEAMPDRHEDHDYTYLNKHATDC